MTTDDNRLADAFEVALGLARELQSDGGIVGYGVVELRGPDGALKECQPFANMITNYGDTYYCWMAVTGVPPANITALTPLVSRMKLGTGSTAVNKAAGTGENIGTYVSSITATKAFDASFPTKATASANSGAAAIYKTTWNAGEATQAGLNEATISTDTTDTADVAGECISRVVFAAPITKGASDTLAITWTHLFKGA